MPPPEVLDPALVLDEWINRVQNLPDEVRFIQEEIADKDRQYNDCIKLIEERDGRIQKWIKANGSHEPNPREDGYRQTIRENFTRAEQFANDKIALTTRLQHIVDKHLRALDIQIKALYDRNEPGFTDPDEIPSILRPSPANQSAPTIRPVSTATSASTIALNPILNNASQTSIRASNPQIKTTQSHQHGSSSAPATPAASMILNRQARESSAGPGSGAPKRGPRVNLGLGNTPTLSSGLARHSSLGPGTPKSHTATGVQRAGSAGPRATTKGGASSGAGGRKAGTPTATGGRKKGTPAAGAGATKSGLSRVKRVAKNSPSSAAESEASGVDTGSDEDSDARTGGRGTPAAARSAGPDKAGGSGSGSGSADKEDGQHHERPGPGARAIHHGRDGLSAKARAAKAANDDEDAMDVDDDEAGDDKKYCICQNVSFGDMVACDNDACPYEWFHWSCVGLKSEPNGKWFCPVCTENMKKKAK